MTECIQFVTEWQIYTVSTTT